MKRIMHPRAAGGRGFARYGYKWSEIGLRVDTKRVAIAALKALYGSAAAWAAIREARRVSGKKR
jgi:hypothetical protein